MACALACHACALAGRPACRAPAPSRALPPLPRALTRAQSLLAGWLQAGGGAPLLARVRAGAGLLGDGVRRHGIRVSEPALRRAAAVRLVPAAAAGARREPTSMCRCSWSAAIPPSTFDPATRPDWCLQPTQSCLICCTASQYCPISTLRTGCLNPPRAVGHRSSCSLRRHWSYMPACRRAIGLQGGL